MGTIVTIELASTFDQASATSEAIQSMDRAFAWFEEVERVCNRFDPGSELRQLTARPGVPAEAGTLLFAVLEFALAIADASGGAFDPTVGDRMERRGFNRDYRSGAAIDPSVAADGDVSFRDVHIDTASRLVTIDRPLTLDLSALAKGFAVDLAARELASFEDFAIEAGGDLYVSGHNAAGAPWSIGVRHPRRDREAITRVRLSDAAICTSGDYERHAEGGHHIINPRSVDADDLGDLASVTVIAPTAMLADALATAAFVLGPVEGLRLLERHGVEGLLYSPSLERLETAGIAEIEDRG